MDCVGRRGSPPVTHLQRGGVDLGIELPRVSWMFDGAVLHDDGMCILVVSRRPELVMVISLNELGPEAVFRIGHALGNRHSPAELHGNELLVPVTDTPDLVADRSGPRIA